MRYWDQGHVFTTLLEKSTTVFGRFFSSGKVGFNLKPTKKCLKESSILAELDVKKIWNILKLGMIGSSPQGPWWKSSLKPPLRESSLMQDAFPQVWPLKGQRQWNVDLWILEKRECNVASSLVGLNLIWPDVHLCEDMQRYFSKT